jgi:hypothetical protein
MRALTGMLNGCLTRSVKIIIGDGGSLRGIGDSRDLARAFEPTGRVAGGSVSLHAGFAYIDALT